MSTENKPLHFWVSLRHWKQFAEGKMHIAYTWDVDYKEAGCTLKFVEIAAVEQLKAELEELKSRHSLNKKYARDLEEIGMQLKSKLAKAKLALKRYADPETKCFVSADYESIARQVLLEIGEG